jgi:hypothetical protein
MSAHEAKAKTSTRAIKAIAIRFMDFSFLLRKYPYRASVFAVTPYAADDRPGSLSVSSGMVAIDLSHGVFRKHLLPFPRTRPQPPSEATSYIV